MFIKGDTRSLDQSSHEYTGTRACQGDPDSLIILCLHNLSIGALHDNPPHRAGHTMCNEPAAVSPSPFTSFRYLGFRLCEFRLWGVGLGPLRLSSPVLFLVAILVIAHSGTTITIAASVGNLCPIDTRS